MACIEGRQLKVLNVEPKRYSDDMRAQLAAAGDVHYIDVIDEAGLVSALAAAPYEALFTRIGLHIGKRAIEACPTLKCVVTPTTGIDHLDMATLASAGVRVVSLRGETEFLRNVRSTAEHTWALLLALVRRIPAAFTDVLGGSWNREMFLASELHGKTLGLIGVGRLGRMVAEYGAAFRMRVIGFDRAFDASESAVIPVSVEQLLREADVVSVHLSLDKETIGFLSRKRFQSMKRGALLVNTARGELVDEEALLDALVCGDLGGAALDVLAGDSVWEGHAPSGHPLIQYARSNTNLILTPHAAGYGRDSIEATRRFVIAKYLEAHKDGGTV